MNDIERARAKRNGVGLIPPATPRPGVHDVSIYLGGRLVFQGTRADWFSTTMQWWSEGRIDSLQLAELMNTCP